MDTEYIMINGSEALIHNSDTHIFNRSRSAEAARLAPLFAGVTYDRLEGYQSLQWPVAEDGTDTPLLFEKEFPLPDGKARLWPVQWTKPLQFDDPTTYYIS